ncbi:MAG: SGNH/GDSL hydrolase family protein [Lentisphaerota bacterium]
MMLFLKKLSVLLAAILLPLLVLEMAIRIFGGGKPPSLDMNFDRSRFYYRYSGARQSPWAQGATNALKVAVIGDSISNGAGSQKDDSYPFRLERFLNMNEGQRPAEVRVYAKGGTSTFMQLGFLNEALKRRPDVVILGVCLNDTEDWTRPDELKRWRDERMPHIPKPWLAAVLKHSRALNWMYKKIQDVRGNRAFLKDFERLYDPHYSGWKRFVAAIHEFKMQCDKAEAKLVVVVFPELSRVNDYPFDYVHERIRQVMDTERIYCLDLLGDYRGKNPDRLQAVPHIDGHPNEIGHRIAAESILEYLLANQLIDAGYLPKNRTGGGDTFWKRVSDRMQNPAGESERKDNVDPSIMVDP